jgi:hypothetical protein
MLLFLKLPPTTAQRTKSGYSVLEILGPGLQAVLLELLA